SDYGSGLFPPEFYEAEMDILQRCIPDGSVGLQSKNSLFPPLLLNINKIVNIFSKIFSSDFYNRTRILRLDRVEPEVESVLPPGKCNCFEARIFVNQKQVLPEYPKDILQKQKLKLLFDKGAGRIFWEGVELTKKLGFYTSIRLGGRWHDSFSSALWKILHNDERSIKALGKWLHLPISQSWQISLEGTNCFDVYISMIAEEDIEIERLQANLMISERYPHWESGNAKGDFPSFRSDIGDDWDCVVSAGRESSSIGASFNAGHDNALPSVSLSFKGSSLQGSLNVLNSDLFHRARLLQYLVAERTKIQPGEYLCFHGRIAVL
ncbi:MAG: hypothetical protein KJ880_01085, partial [Candidatus Omnitrophica bacterium]|nr:hypothetical protein [Candidatus Omnitrophota bacterium]